MNDIFVTGDTHFGQKGILKFRPFQTVQEMDETIIENYNNVVKPGDTVYHIGDLCHTVDVKVFHSYLSRLNGRIILIKGNHDRTSWKAPELFTGPYNMYETIIEGRDVTFCHYAMLMWKNSHRGAYHLYGHSHGTLEDNPHSLSFDVGVDCHDFKPLHWSQVVERMKTKTWKAIDKHK